LLEGVAYLNSRIQKKLDDDFPELTDALLGSLYPHYQRPIPSLSIAQFSPDESLDKVINIEKGALLKTDSIDQESSLFKTCYPVSLLPLMVESAEILYPPFRSPGSKQYSDSKSALHLKIATTSKDVLCNDLDLECLRFYLRGQPQHVYPLYELIFNSIQGCVVSQSEDDTSPFQLSRDVLESVGFESQEGLFPFREGSFSEYQLLSEFFAFPEKFLFLQINKLLEALTVNETDSFHLYLYFSDIDSELEHHISSDTFALGCSPVVNLFEKHIDPIHLDQSQYRYHLVPDSRQIEKLEIYSAESVVASSNTGEDREFLPFHGLRHENKQDSQDCYWFTNRRSVTDSGIHKEKASELDITLVDLDYKWFTSTDLTLNIKCLCFNRNLPNKLPFGHGQPRLHLVDEDIGASKITCIAHPTKVIRPPTHKQAYWRLYSHLQLNSLSLSNSSDATEALKEILRLYEYCGSPQSNANIDAIYKLSTQVMVAPVKVMGYTSMCRGNSITLEINEDLLVGKSSYLFATIIDRFLGLYCSINSFTRLIVKSKNTGKIVKQWPLRSGKKQLL